MSYSPKSGHTGPHSFWTSPDGRLEIYRHTDGVFELLCEGVQVMPIGKFETICDYLWAEFLWVEVGEVGNCLD